MSNRSLQERKNKAFARGQGTITPVFIEKALNAELWDVDGNRYIDLGSGIAVVNTGHNHPKVQAAVQAQLKKFSHTCLTVTPYACAVELAEKLNTIAPGTTPKKTILVTTGAEAVENCIKIARSYTGRTGIIAFNGSFHGRTNLAMGLTGRVAPYKTGFGPFPGEIYHVPYPNTYHNILVEESLKAISTLFAVETEPERVAAIIIEPVQGEGGFYQAPVGFLQALRGLCDQHGILLILDEVQCGMGRTGKLFAHEWAGITPDIMMVAKGLGGGFPIGALLATENAARCMTAGSHGSTYGGNPLGAAVGLAVMDIVAEPEFLAEVSRKSGLLRQNLEGLVAAHPDVFEDVRGTGLMLGLKCRIGNLDLINAGYGQQILTLPAAENVVRLLPPLNIRDDDIAEALKRLDAAASSL